MVLLPVSGAPVPGLGLFGPGQARQSVLLGRLGRLASCLTAGLVPALPGHAAHRGRVAPRRGLGADLKERKSIKISL